MNMEFVKKHLPWFIGGGFVVVIIVYELFKPAPAASGADPSIDPTTGVPYSVETQQQGVAAQVSAQNAQIAAQAQAEHDSNTLATNQLNASIAATQAAQQIAGVQAIGQAVSGIESANAAIPVAAINAAAAQNQIALQSAAGVAATAVGAVPGVIQGAGQVLAAANAPSYALYGSLANSAGAQAINSLGSNLASSEQASASVSKTAIGVSGQTQQSNNQLIGTVGTIAAIALL
jgi:hypothetical protein